MTTKLQFSKAQKVSNILKGLVNRTFLGNESLKLDENLLKVLGCTENMIFLRLLKLFKSFKILLKLFLLLVFSDL